MTVELLSVLALLTGGCACLRSVGVTGWALPGLGFLAGLCLYLTIGSVLVVAHVPGAPPVALVLTATLPLAWWLTRLARGEQVTVPPRYAVLTLAGVVLAVVVLRSAHLVNWHTDSFRYVLTGSMLANGSYHDAVSMNLLTKRMLAVPLSHAPAGLAGEYYLRSVVPLLAAATLVALVWLFREGTRGRVDPTRYAAFAVLGVLLLATNNRFLFHAFYLNGHLLFGALLLLIAGCGWLLVRRDRAAGATPDRALLVLQLIAIPPLVVSRPEASIVAGLALLPMLLSDRVPLRHRSAALGTLGASIVVWQGFVAVTLNGQGAAVPAATFGELLCGAALLLLIPALRWSYPVRHRITGLWLVEAGLWVALLVLAAGDARILRDSVAATVRNVVSGAGSWGLSLVVLAVLVTGVLALGRVTDRIHLRYPLTTFLPLVLLLAYLRDDPYRVGDGDSLNRMLIQLVPLAVLLVIVTMAGDRWRWGRPAAPAPAVPGRSRA